MWRQRQADTARSLPHELPQTLGCEGQLRPPHSLLKDQEAQTQRLKQSVLSGCLGEERPPYLANPIYGAVKSPKDQRLEGQRSSF